MLKNSQSKNIDVCFMYERSSWFTPEKCLYDLKPTYSFKGFDPGIKQRNFTLLLCRSTFQRNHSKFIKFAEKDFIY